MKLSAMAQALGVTFDGQDIDIQNFSSDTRALQRGDMFIALSGANFDANDFISKAQASGAVAALVSRKDESVSIPQLVVADTFIGLGQLAKAWREQYELTRVAITGSAGKTTTKEMTATIFRQMGETLFTLGNKNNELGVPLTLLRIQSNHQYGVFELGANHKGEIAYTSALVQPHAAVIVNVGNAHLEGFGSRQGIAEAKSEIYDGLVDGGVAIINIDDDFADLWLKQNSSRKIIRISTKQAADVFASDIQQLASGHFSFNLHIDTQVVAITLQLLGRHNISNAVAAAALAHACGISAEKIQAGLNTTLPVPGRMIVKTTKTNHFVIDDTYNANPSSMCAAIDVLADMQGRKVLILGDMGELGDAAEQSHKDIGEYARMKKIDALYAVGQYSSFTTSAFGEGAKAYSNQTALIADLERELEGVVTLLVKGSRSARMENVVNALTDSTSMSEEQH